MRILPKIILNTILSVTVTSLIASFMMLALGEGSQTITVTATVPPLRLIVVDENSTIQKIISNTKEDVRPIVVLNTEDGYELPYSQEITTQYLELKESLNFSKPGTIYIRENGIQSFYRKTQESINKLLGLALGTLGFAV